LGQALEVRAGQVVEQQVVVELEQSAEPVLEIVLDRHVGSQQTIQGSVQPVLGHSAVGHAKQVFQSRGGVPMLGQGERAARTAQAIDDFDRDDVGGSNRFFSLRQT